ncbi:MAG: hypothetical protein WBV93_13170 [Anaerobacillus sp.]
MSANDGLGVFFGLFGVLYFAIILFITVVTVVFLFKAMGYMKRKNASDQKHNELLRQLITKQTTSNDIHKEDDSSY